MEKGKAMNALQAEQKRNQMIKTQSRCPVCGGELASRWCETGPNPSTKVYVRKCSSCLGLISECKIVDATIEKYRAMLTWYREIGHIADRVKDIRTVTRADPRKIIARLVAAGLWVE